jgi:UDP-N-acetylglucosamine:LPS N-acetylglucosamine transferase
VYSRVGGGHLSAARALACELNDSGKASTLLLDAYVDGGRFPVTLFPWAYAQLARRHPRLWATIYRMAEARISLRRTLGPFLNPGVRRLVARERPDAIVSVLPAVNDVLARAAAAFGARMEVVLTDWHSVHPLWVAPGVQYYTVPTGSAGDDCVRFGVPREHVEVVGIPVRRAFAALGGPASARSAFTILAMVGAEGSPHALRNLAQLARMPLDQAELIVVCGRNAELRRQVARLPARMRVQALGFADNVADLMRAADVLVTKPGGLTLAEAFCCAVPVVVHDVLPGQEAGNLRYVLGQHAVAYAPDARTLERVIGELYAHPVRRAELAERGARLARPDAARHIARGLLQRLEAS